jgi:subtilisin family serine protease
MARSLEYYSNNRRQRIEVTGLFDSRQARRSEGIWRFPVRPQTLGLEVLSLLAAQPMTLRGRFSSRKESDLLIAPVGSGQTTVLPTSSVAISGAKSTELKWAEKDFGASLIAEGRHGKALLRVPDEDDDPIEVAAELSRQLYERGRVDGAHPDFVRLVQRPAVTELSLLTQWALDNPGNPGVVGADVAALAAWTISEGDPSIRVAILDEGVDTAHPYLASAVVEERDFVNDQASAAPEGDDAHGTACAGIALSRADEARGLAPQVSLVAARIAKSGPDGDSWLFDDFQVADAIDWAWDDAKAAVLSNSWGGGPPVDIITMAIDRAQTRGRDGLGSVVVFAAGNDQGQVEFPGNLPGVLGVGASNEWDQRKTRASLDGERLWGSNSGRGLDLMAPGVHILTTDISGPRGYGRDLTVGAFNGTSAATPFVAAAAGLVLSVRPDLTEEDTRDILTATTDAIGSRTRQLWDPYVGFGRLNVFAALRMARR